MLARFQFLGLKHSWPNGHVSASWGGALKGDSLL